MRLKATVRPIKMVFKATMVTRRAIVNGLGRKLHSRIMIQRKRNLKGKPTIGVPTTKHGLFTSHRIAKANHGRKKRWEMKSQIKRRQP